MSEGWWIVILLRNGRAPWYSGAIENRDDARDVAKEWFSQLSQLGGDFTVQIAKVEEVFGVAASSG